MLQCIGKYQFCLLPVLCAVIPAFAQTNISFAQRDIAEHIYDGGWEFFVGGGVAVFDCNGDDLPELYVAGGKNPASLFRNTSQSVLGFRRDTPDVLALTEVTGAYALDLDADRHSDLAILRVGENQLLRGLGNCRFTPFDSRDFVSADRWTTAFSATWESGQRLPTLAFGNYVDRRDSDGPFGACETSSLYRPDGNRYAQPIALTPGYCVLSMLFSDWGRMGRADLRVSNDRHYYVKGGQEQLWAMEAVPRLYSEQEGWLPYRIWGMGIASRDINGDGFADVYLTSMGDQKLQYFAVDRPGPGFVNARYERGISAHRPYTGSDGRPSTGWHAAFGDVNNDGRDDIFVAKGNVEQMPDAAMDDPNNLLVQQTDGTFKENGKSAGIASMERGRGGALVDLNLDGALDIIVVNRRAPMELYENMTDGGNWLLADISAPPPNTYAVGAIIEVAAGNFFHTREITIGGGHASGNLGLHHFGLGENKHAKLRVIWTDGKIGDWQKVRSNQILRISR